MTPPRPLGLRDTLATLTALCDFVGRRDVAYECTRLQTLLETLDITTDADLTQVLKAWRERHDPQPPGAA